MKETVVGGRFVLPDGSPAQGTVKFIPSMVWIDDDDGLSYPCHAPEAVLVDGRFAVVLTRTDTYLYDWFYTAHTPIGRWTIWVEDDGPLNLKDLLPKTAT